MNVALAAGVLQMKQRRRIYYSESQTALMWERWRKGESLQHIAQLFNRNHSSVQRILAQTGGIQPAPRRRSKLALTLAEREEISRGLVAGDRFSQSPGDCRDHRRRSVARSSVIVGRPAIGPANKLQLQWSPQQIAGWLKRAWPGNEDYHVSHETIYRSLFIQARSALKKELLEHLRRTRAMRRSRHHTQKTDDHGRIHDAVSISERPATVEDRAVPGHWEGDLLRGSAGSQIATLVERQTRYVMLVKIASKDSESVANALIKHAGKLPQELYKSLTWDRGTEMADHKRFTIAIDIAVYFCDPKHPWQRGSNENTNGLLRQYFPKGIGLSVYSQAKLNAVARRLNERPRKTLDCETPAERFHRTIALTG
ncbi:IS30 family transposase [Paraburkholderia youngii]|uniref:IS30 family transposase n=1 Tax=Paraburkholderia youngii TaxID=2782701 RepID=UPI003D24BD34